MSKDDIVQFYERQKQFDDEIKESIECCSIFKDQQFLKKIVSVTNAEGPPVPIPNTEVKLCSGENTLREAVREDSPMLTYIRET